MSNSDLDLLAIVAHPDDAELQAGGTLALAARAGRRVGIVDLTRGETATRGTPELRAGEAAIASKILGLAHRETLDLGDGDLANTQERRSAVVSVIRRLRPRIVMVNALDGRHPDHRRAHELVRDSVFLANVGGFKTGGERWHTEAVVWPAIAARDPDPRAEWIVDVTPTWELKLAVLAAYSTQINASAQDANMTYTASREFREQIERRARAWGHFIGVQFGEPFIFDRPAHAAHPFVRLMQD